MEGHEALPPALHGKQHAKEAVFVHVMKVRRWLLLLLLLLLLEAIGPRVMQGGEGSILHLQSRIKTRLVTRMDALARGR